MKNHIFNTILTSLVEWTGMLSERWKPSIFLASLQKLVKVFSLLLTDRCSLLTLSGMMDGETSRWIVPSSGKLELLMIVVK